MSKVWLALLYFGSMFAVGVYAVRENELLDEPHPWYFWAGLTAFIAFVLVTGWRRLRQP